MNAKRSLLLLPVLALLAVPAAAQLNLPGGTLRPLPRLPVDVGSTVEGVAGELGTTADRLLRLRDVRIARLLRQNSAFIERDARGAPARRGELLLVDPTPDHLRAAQEAGFAVAGQEDLQGLGLAVVRLRLPQGTSLAEGEALLLRAAPSAQVAPDNLHFQSGAAPAAQGNRSAQGAPAPAAPVGVIDGAPAQKVAALRGFAKGAPVASDHGSAVVSLLAGSGVRDVRVADVYGTDPAGGNALALVRGLDWLVSGGARVVSISLAGPSNTLVGKAVASARAKGVVLVAAVGNDGPAAPPAYPASYPGVLAVTGVDARNRPLIEAGRALHLDYAAPGADIFATNRAGKWGKVRGTSFATPLVAARAAAAVARGAPVRATLDGEAQDLGPRGEDRQYGRGLLCGTCAKRR